MANAVDRVEIRLKEKTKFKDYFYEKGNSRKK
jgi:hypothetical protein